MKKLAIILFTGLLYFSQSAQTAYNKMLVTDTTTWQHFGVLLGVKSSQALSINLGWNSMAAIDTITLNGNIYKKLYELAIPAAITYTNKILRGYMREDTLAKKVYFKENIANPEFVLYDFSLSLNDSIVLSFPYNPLSNGYYRVDSIVTKAEMCGPRKHFYLRKHVNNSTPSLYYFEYIESIGSTYHLLYPYNNGLNDNYMSFPPNCNHKWMLGLACKKNKTNQQYQSCTSALTFWNNYTNGCNYYFFTSSLNELSGSENFSIYPNPASSSIRIAIDSDKNTSINVHVIDVFGKVLQSHKNATFSRTNNSYELNTSALESGVYSLLIEGDNFKSSKTFLIQK